MSVGDYLKVAAAQLRRASMARKSETQDLRKEISDRERDVHKMTDNLKHLIAQRQREMNFIDNGPLRAERTAEIARLNSEISTLQTNLEREKQRVIQELNWKESQAEDLNVQASNFERQANSMNGM